MYVTAQGTIFSLIDMQYNLKWDYGCLLTTWSYSHKHFIIYAIDYLLI